MISFLGCLFNTSQESNVIMSNLPVLYPWKKKWWKLREPRKLKLCRQLALNTKGCRNIFSSLNHNYKLVKNMCLKIPELHHYQACNQKLFYSLSYVSLCPKPTKVNYMFISTDMYFFSYLENFLNMGWNTMSLFAFNDKDYTKI